MDNYNFLIKYQNLQNEVIYDEINRELDFATVTYSQDDPSEYDNYALLSHLPTEAELSTLENTFKKHMRKPVLYFSEDMFSTSDVDFLVKNNYKKTWEDAWMAYETKLKDIPEFSSVKRVLTEEDLEIFIRVFDNSYQKGDPQNPYGDVKNYIPVTIRAWHKFGKTDRLHYFIAYKENQPVATSILNSLDELGYISSVGSLKEVRGQGYGKLATLYAVYISQQLRNKYHVLATEEGTYPNEFYKRIGFVTKFRALGYSHIDII